MMNLVEAAISLLKIELFYQFAFCVDVRFELKDGVLFPLAILVDVIRQEGVTVELVAVHFI